MKSLPNPTDKILGKNEMPISALIGAQHSYVRCYRVAHTEEVKQFKSVGQIPEFSQVHSLVARGSILYVKKDFLPPDLGQALSTASSFQRFCRLVAFTRIAYLTRLGVNLPTFPTQHGHATFQAIPGFSLPAPAAIVDLNCAESMSPVELRGFLKSFYPFAGQTVVVNLNNVLRQTPLSTTEAADIIKELSMFLNPASDRA